jgi:hypothetical protein
MGLVAVAVRLIAFDPNFCELFEIGSKTAIGLIA